ncbi:hypothetical protein ATO6_04875 [Oceanicola sp. 22II-s10i]|uniref:OmpA family protein n=1 Tax=Oceanicola sp. 22II-s10i TaxID=1317116 RepID=UPI000B51FEFD|nr:OmpA family protein [Oceanicola sp. 22II-s10i]OWU86185.1 hypothetical protein ATO6_04875 [Oceanicola sp. 22II-s10i]
MLGLSAGPGLAFDLALPTSARVTAESISDHDSYSLPVGVFSGGRLPVLEVEGRVTRRAWQVPTQGMTTLQFMAPFREQVTKAGYDIILECADRACGGFDFRYATELFQAPAMIVDLFDYRVLTASRGTGDRASHLLILVSNAATSGYIQAVVIEPEGAQTGTGTPPPSDVAEPLPEVPEDAEGVSARLERDGHVALADLEFATGSSDLTEGSYTSLAALALYLKSSPGLRIALVGHTDTQGSLEANIALSRRRAQSVAERLVDRHGVPRGQLDAEGMGYLAPIASNLSAAGREANRRVEAVLLNTEIPNRE